MPAVFLGVASAAIAFAFHETADRELAWPLLPILGAVLCWAGSFASGVLFSRAYAAGIKSNIGMNFAKKSAQADWEAEAKEKFDKANKKAARRYAAQQWLLLAGAGLYLIGHVWLISETSRARLSEATSAEASHTGSPHTSTAQPLPATPPERTDQSSPQ